MTTISYNSGETTREKYISCWCQWHGFQIFWLRELPALLLILHFAQGCGLRFNWAPILLRLCILDHTGWRWGLFFQNILNTPISLFRHKVHLTPSWIWTPIKIRWSRVTYKARCASSWYRDSMWEDHSIIWYDERVPPKCRIFNLGLRFLL